MTPRLLNGLLAAHAEVNGAEKPKETYIDQIL